MLRPDRMRRGALSLFKHAPMGSDIAPIEKHLAAGVKVGRRASSAASNAPKHTDRPRTTCFNFNVHGFRIAVHRITGEIRILQSVHAADAGVILNPMQCRGQVEGAVAQGIGSSLFERMVFDTSGKMMNPTFRNYRISAFADIPRTEVFFADTYDAYGPLGAKSAGETPIIPVAPALGNALADATGIRFQSPPWHGRSIPRVGRAHPGRPGEASRLPRNVSAAAPCWKGGRALDDHSSLRHRGPPRG